VTSVDGGEQETGSTNPVKRLVRRVGHAMIMATMGVVVRRAAHVGPKRISAMMRVKNEGEYLGRAVASILDVVDEIVIVDNNSTDETPQIIADLIRQNPGKVRTAEYPHNVARYGEENRALASTFRGRRSPRLLANFYNWSVAQCRHEFILKWDGDTIATRAFHEQVAVFKESDKQAMWINGVNLHPNLTHMVRLIPYEPVEPRLFFRRFAKYTNYLGYCEGLESPYVGRFPQYSEFFEDQPSYLHMKYCKKDRLTHMSEDLQRLVADNRVTDVGDPLTPLVLDEVAAWQLA
jgi:Glycosyl transferase family 2